MFKNFRYDEVPTARGPSAPGGKCCWRADGTQVQQHM